MQLNNFETDKVFDYENGFYTTTTEDRLGNLLLIMSCTKK